MTVSRCMLLKVPKTHFKSIWCAIPGFRAEFMVRIFGKSCRLEHILQHSFAQRAFYDFVRSEHAGENVDFFDAVTEYKSQHGQRSAEESMGAAELIVKDFLSADSAREVNVQNAMINSCKCNLEAVSAKIDPSKRVPPRGLFDDCVGEIYKILEMGPFTRYKKSKAFIQLLIKLRAYEQMDLSNISSSAHGSSPRRVSFAPPPTYDQQREFIMDTKLG